MSETTYQSFFQQNRFSDLIDFAKKQGLSVASNPHDSRYYAAALFRLGDYKEALSLLEELTPIYGENPDHLSLLAATYRRLGQLEYASSCFNKALKINPDSSTIKNNYANLLIDLQDYDQALALLDSVLETNPDYEDAKVNRERLLALKTNYVAQSSNDLEFDPLSLAFTIDEVKSAKSRYIKTDQSQTSNFPSPPQGKLYEEQLNLIEKSIDEGEYAFALSICSKVLQAFGVSPYIYEKASDAYINLSRFDDAERSLLQSIALGGSSQKHYFNLVSLVSMRGDTSLARHYLLKAKEFDSNSPLISKLSDQINSIGDASSFKF